MTLKLLKIRCVNACQHRDLELEFGEGLTAICGPNGVGKSNLIGLALASVTNDFSNTGAGTKESNICYYRGNKEPAYVKTVWQVPAGVVEISRDLKGTQSYVALNGEAYDSVGKEAVVTERAVELLGVPLSVLKSFTIAGFYQLQRISHGTKSERAEMILSLCGSDQLKQLDRALQEQITADKAIAGEFDASQLSRLRASYKEQALACGEVRAKLRAAKLSPEDEQYYQTASKDIAEYRDKVSNREVVERDYNREANRVKELESKLPPLRDRWKAREHKLVAARQEAAALRPLIDAEEKRENSRQQWEAASQEVHSLRVALQECDDSMPVQEPQPPRSALPGLTDTLKSLEELQDMQSSLRVLVDKLRGTVSLWEKSKEGVCPTCSQPIKMTQQEYESKKADLRNQSHMLTVLGSYITEYSLYQTKHGEYTREVAAVSREKDRLTELYTASVARLQSIPTPDDSTSDADRSQQAETHTRLLNSIAEMESEKERDRATGAIIQDQLKEARSQVRSLGSQLTPLLPFTRDKLQRKEQAMQSLADRRNASAVLQAEFDGSLRAVRRASQDVRNAKARQKKLSKRVDRVKFFAAIRQVLTKDRLPTRLVRGLFLKVSSQVNVFLQQMEIPFSVEPDPDNFAFSVRHPDARLESAAALSSGQGLCVGIAFWLSRAAVFETQLPFFCLDEPTANVDSKNVAAVADAMALLSDRLVAEGRQGFVITHHQEVANSATKVISL